MKKTPINDNPTTRIIPGLSAEYQIVSLPYWAWYWLEDFMQQNRISYRGIIDTFGGHDDIGNTLRNIAELHHEHAMREVYNLANDNEADDHVISMRARRKAMPKGAKAIKAAPLILPKIYKLFGFMSCATTLEAVWERKNYEDSNKIR